jgi:hypothetical protein
LNWLHQCCSWTFVRFTKSKATLVRNIERFLPGASTESARRPPTCSPPKSWGASRPSSNVEGLPPRAQVQPTKSCSTCKHDADGQCCCSSLQLCDVPRGSQTPARLRLNPVDLEHIAHLVLPVVAAPSIRACVMMAWLATHCPFVPTLMSVQEASQACLAIRVPVTACAPTH